MSYANHTDLTRVIDEKDDNMFNVYKRVRFPQNG